MSSHFARNAVGLAVLSLVSCLAWAQTDGAATTVSCDSDVTVGGMIAAVGSRLIEGTARRMMDRFFERLAEQLSKGA